MKPLTLLACAGLCVSTLTAPASAGDLNPPPGPVTPTMKSLDEIMPGVSVSDLPGGQGASHVISSPGVFALSGDIVGTSGEDCIVVDCDGFAPGEHTVTISMRGFSLRGVPGAANAITVRNTDPANRRVHVVIDGSVAPGTGASLISGWAVDGVHVEGATSCSITGVRVVGCGGDGFDVSRAGAGTSVNIVTSSFESCGGNGVLVSMPAGAPSSLEIQEISCVGNGESGARILYAASGATGGHARVRIRDASLHENSLDGLHITGGVEDSISYDFEDLHSARNGGAGVRASMDRQRSRAQSVAFHRCSAGGNFGDGFVFTVGVDATDASTIVGFNGCDANGNGGDGFRCAVPASAPGTRHVFVWNSCAAVGNTLNGFSAIGGGVGDRRASMDGCRALGNGGSGIHEESMDASLDACVASGNQMGGAIFLECRNIRVQSCDFSDNTGDGLALHGGGGGGGSTGAVFIFVRSTASGNTGNGSSVFDFEGDGQAEVVVCSNNGGSGMVFGSAAGLGCGSPSIVGCASNGNGLSGFDLNCTSSGLVRRCEASRNGEFGFVIGGNGHTVIENVATGNTLQGYLLSMLGNSVGPIVDQGGIAQNSNPAANYVR